MRRATRWAAAMAAATALAGCGAHVMPTWTPGDAATATPTATTTPRTTPAPTSTPRPSPTLQVVDALIPYGPQRREQMADYSLRRYGERTADLTPTAIVLHFTESPDDPWVTINLFAANEPNGGTLPGVCTHYVIDKAGVIYHLVDDATRCRHTVGLNHVALGIELVQATEGHSSQWADEQILAREPQMTALLTLVHRLQAEHGIATDRVIGHGTANDDPEFKDLTGMRNDHTDIGPDAVAAIRARLDATATP